MSQSLRPTASLRRFAGELLRAPRTMLASVEELLKQRHCVLGARASLLPTSKIENPRGDKRAIVIGENSKIAGHLFVFAHGGSIQIGRDCFVGEGSKIWSTASITIGHRVLVSHGVNIHDNISHPISARSRHEQVKAIFSTGHPTHLADVPERPVVIEDDAWIGFNAVVLKGVTIGRGAIVGAAAVVVKDVAPFSIVVGNPARCIGDSRP